MIKIHKSIDGQYYYTYCGKNGKVKNTSETYTRKASCIRAAKAFQKDLYAETPIKYVHA